MPDTTKQLTDQRGNDYGHPLDHFPTTRAMFAAWEKRRNNALANGADKLTDEQEASIRHAAYMMCDKLARFAQSPMKVDHLSDVQGYARTAKMALGLEE